MKTILVILLFLTLASTRAQSPSPSPTPACTAAEFRQFDFWLGKWTVRNPKGDVSGSSEITRASEGCAMREDWTGARGTTGMSINYYDAEAKKWHQDWVGGDGVILHLQGGLENGAMILSDKSNRVTWTPLPERKVKQEWTTSVDGGATWKTSFVGIYEPR